MGPARPLGGYEPEVGPTTEANRDRGYMLVAMTHPLTLEKLRTALVSGAFFAVDDGQFPKGEGPRVTWMCVAHPSDCPGLISISTQDGDETVRWIANGSSLVGTGFTLDLTDRDSAVEGHKPVRRQDAGLVGGQLPELLK